MVHTAILTAGVVAFGAVAFAMPALAQDTFPSRTVEVVHQYGPGGGTDRFIRAVAEPFQDLAGVSMVSISVQGGGGVPAFVNFTQRPRDGHSLMAIGPDQIIADALGRIDMGELKPLTRVQWDQGLFMVPADSPFQTIQDFIVHARANPGDIKMGITGSAGFDDTLVGMWNLESGAQVTTVPFGSAEMVSNTLGGQVDAMYEEYGPARGLIEAGSLRPLVVFSDQRLPVLPDVPTAKELGFDVTLGRWRAFAVPVGIPDTQAEALHSLVQQATQTESYKAFEEQSALQFRSVVIGPEEFAAFVEQERQTYGQVLRQLGFIE